MKIHKLLIANRGEIALRIINTCKKLNIKTVAVLTESEKSAHFLSFFWPQFGTCKHTLLEPDEQVVPFFLT